AGGDAGVAHEGVGREDLHRFRAEAKHLVRVLVDGEYGVRVRLRAEVTRGSDDDAFGPYLHAGVAGVAVGDAAEADDGFVERVVEVDVGDVAEQARAVRGDVRRIGRLVEHSARSVAREHYLLHLVAACYHEQQLRFSEYGADRSRKRRVAEWDTEQGGKARHAVDVANARRVADGVQLAVHRLVDAAQPRRVDDAVEDAGRGLEPRAPPNRAR